MEKQIGIVIPEGLKSEIISFGNRYNCEIAEPHVTLIPYEMLQGAKGVERNLQSFCLSQPQTQTIIGGPNIEASEDFEALFLVVIMGPLNAARDRLMNHLKLPTYSGVFRPRVPLVKQAKGGACDLNQMLADAKTVFSKPRSISVDALAIYTRSGKDEPYRMGTSYLFTGR